MTQRGHISGNWMACGLMLAVFFLPMMAEAAVDCTKYPGLTNYIAGCIRDTLDSSVSVFFAKMYPILQRAIAAMLIISVSIFGVMAAFGMLEKVGRDSFMLLIKIVFVSYFVAHSSDLYRFVLLAMDSTAERVVSYVPTSGASDNTGGDFSQITCIQKAKETGPTRTVNIQTIGFTAVATAASGPWLAMDCMVDSTIGIRLPNMPNADKVSNPKMKSSEEGISRGLVFLFFSTLQTSALGIFIAVIGFIFLWGIVHLLIRALYIYLLGYVGLSILMIFAPLFIPMVLFQSTKSYFDKWIKLIISFALQPIIILIFIVFTISAVDLATFSGKYSVMYALAGDESTKSGFSLNEYLTKARSGGKSIISDTALKYGEVKADLSKDGIDLTDPNATSVVSGLQNSKCTKALMAADENLKKACENSYPLQIFRKSLDWDMLAEARTPAVVVSGDAKTKGQQISRMVIASLIFAAVVVFIMNQLLAVIPNVANDLLGDYGQGPNLAGAIKGKLLGGVK